MAEHDDIKQRFTERLTAKQGQNKVSGLQQAEFAEQAFAPIVQTLSAISEVIREQKDPAYSLIVHNVTRDGSGSYFIKAKFSKHNVHDNLIIKLITRSIGGNKYAISGLDGDAREHLLEPTRSASSTDVIIDANRSLEVGEALEIFAANFFA